MKDHEWNVRIAGASGAAGIAALVRRAFAAQSRPTVPPSGALRETAATMTDHLARGGAGVVEVDGALLGFILWKEEEGALYLSRLAVHPGYRRRGIARALIDEAEREAIWRGLSAMTLGVRRELDDNRRVFESCGFVETGPTYHEGFVEATGVRMERRLGNR